MSRGSLSLRHAVRKRAHNCCEKCRTNLSRKKHGKSQGTIHHRLPRRLGGPDTISNLILLCFDCHTDIHRHERLAAWEGWIVWADPEVTPVLLPCGWALLVPDGSLERLSPEEGTRLCEYTNGAPVYMGV